MAAGSDVAGSIVNSQLRVDESELGGKGVPTGTIKKRANRPFVSPQAGRILRLLYPDRDFCTVVIFFVGNFHFGKVFLVVPAKEIRCECLYKWQGTETLVFFKVVV